jgi:hypothetical protein
VLYDELNSLNVHKKIWPFWFGPFGHTSLVDPIRKHDRSCWRVWGASREIMSQCFKSTKKEDVISPSKRH